MRKKKVRLKVKNILIFLVIIIVIILLMSSLISNKNFKVDLDSDVYYIGQNYEKKFTATYKGKDVTNKVKVTHNIYNNQIGTYQVTFIYTEADKEYKVTKEIKIKDNEKPVITLNSSQIIMVVLNSDYNEPGYIALDGYDGDITDKVKVSGKVDTTTEGTYTIKYTVEDSSGNKAIEKRKVTVTKNSPLMMNISEFSLEGFYTDVQLQETEKANSDYLSDTIFAGDSTALYYVMNKTISGKQLWHKEGVTLETIFTQDIYINHLESHMTLIESMKDKKPPRMVLTLGTNSVATMEIDYFIKKYEELLNELKKASPSTILIVQSIFPVAKTYDDNNKSLNNDKINKMNYRLLELCSKLEIPFLNTAEVLKDENGTLKEGYYRSSDKELGVHLSEEGNKKAIEYFNTHVYQN